MSDQSLIGTITKYLRTQFFQRGDPFSQRVLLTLYRLIAEGSPVTLESLSAAIGSDGDAVREVVEAVAPSRLQYDKAGRIIAFGGLSQVPANHSFMFAERELFTWCVFDGLFLPKLLDGTARISSICPATGAEIRVTVSQNNLEMIDPDGAVMSFVMPDHESCCADMRGSFCNHVNFFASRQVGEAWLEHNSNAVILSLNDAFAIGQISNRAIFKDVLANQVGPPDVESAAVPLSGANT